MNFPTIPYGESIVLASSSNEMKKEGNKKEKGNQKRSDDRRKRKKRKKRKKPNGKQQRAKGEGPHVTSIDSKEKKEKFMLSHYLAPRVPSPSPTPAFPIRDDLGLRRGPGSPVPFDEETRLGGATTGLWELVPWKIKTRARIKPRKKVSFNHRQSRNGGSITPSNLFAKRQTNKEQHPSSYISK